MNIQSMKIKICLLISSSDSLYGIEFPLIKRKVILFVCIITVLWKYQQWKCSGQVSLISNGHKRCKNNNHNVWACLHHKRLMHNPQWLCGGWSLIFLWLIAYVILNYVWKYVCTLYPTVCTEVNCICHPDYLLYRHLDLACRLYCCNQHMHDMSELV